ncbi:Bifunctional dehydrogenase and ferrochelatase [Apiotrichum porosum]|uniref:precorrin-2 dehydrogenase n=1 Tax=Apiotrichum porosum TaxID=105984 RepID=A0A427XWV4_9TREE|nr:Bifunctional dehydrogenase and ferrochelatase [Apiotrichum porosum]RSH83349.1 Bifunctional dehydrogenase and ferrochelatase [Apiotrichum porosum]
MSETKTYPEIKRGASLLLAWRLEGKRVLLIGGGVVAASRLGFLLESGAHVTLVSPAPLEPSIAHRVATEPEHLTWHERGYGNPDAATPEEMAADKELPVGDFDMVLTAVDDVQLSQAVCTAARTARTPVNVADVPPECDFYFGAQVRRGPLQVMVSTSGAGPKVAVIVRDTVANAIPADVEDAIAGVGALRTELRQRAPGVGGALSKRRMRWMIDTCDAWRLDQMGAMKDPEVRRQLLDDGWEQHKVLRPGDVGAAPGGVKALVGDVVRAAPAWLPTLAAFVAGAAVGVAWVDRVRR